MTRTRDAQAAGFTVVELLIVLAITSVVGALAVSGYRTYSVRAEVAEGIRAAEALEPPIVDAFRHDGEAPADRSAVGLSGNPMDSAAGDVGSIDIANGRIDITYGERASAVIAGRRLSLTPYETAGLAIVWICGNAIPGPGLKPLGFSGGGRQAMQIPTTLEARYLPPACR